MDALTLIIALSAVLWYCVDRFKPLWENVSLGKYITMLVAAMGSFGLVFSFNLDVIAAIGLVAEISLAGKIITGLVLMSGSSAISEIINKIKH
jgi:hypothetical protein